MAGAQIVVLIVAMFVVPQLMQIIPDFDPLMMIVALFGILALAQQFGFQMDQPKQDDGDGPSQAGRRTAASNARSTSGRQEQNTEQDSVAHLLADAERSLQQNSYQRAEDFCKRATDKEPENAKAWELLATAQKWNGKRADALATVQKAQDIYECESAGLSALAQQLSTQEKPEAMIAEIEAKGEDFFSKRMYDLACECYCKALDAIGDADGTEDSRATRLRLLRRRAECAQQLHDWGVCRRDATEVLEADPSDARALLQRASANEALEKFAAALDDARKLLAMDPKNPVANRLVHNCQKALRS